MSVQTMFSVLSATEAQYGSRIALHQPIPGGSSDAKYRTYTWADYKRIVMEIACGLHNVRVTYRKHGRER